MSDFSGDTSKFIKSSKEAAIQDIKDQIRDELGKRKLYGCIEFVDTFPDHLPCAKIKEIMLDIDWPVSMRSGDSLFEEVTIGGRRDFAAAVDFMKGAEGTLDITRGVVSLMTVAERHGVDLAPHITQKIEWAERKMVEEAKDQIRDELGKRKLYGCIEFVDTFPDHLPCAKIKEIMLDIDWPVSMRSGDSLFEEVTIGGRRDFAAAVDFMKGAEGTLDITRGVVSLMTVAERHGVDLAPHITQKIEGVEGKAPVAKCQRPTARPPKI